MRTPWVCAIVCFGVLAATADAQVRATDRLEAMMIASGRETAKGFGLVEERLSVAIDGQHAATTLTQVYRNGLGAQVEGRYRLRAGEGTHVDGFAYWNGEQKIVGEVFERDTARQVYDRVVAKKRDPGLLEEDGDGAFAFKVFPIAANENKRLELRWSQWLDRRAHTIHYRAPVTRTDAEIVVEIAGPVSHLRSATHRFHTEKLANGIRLRSDGATRPGEIDLEWDVDDADWTPQVFVQPGSGPDEGWFALGLASPKLAQAAATPKDVTIVIDRSGSMTGDPIDHAKAAAANMIKLLRDDDRVNVITFDDEVDPLFKHPQALSRDTRSQALQFVDRIHEGGGTDIALALSTAISSQDTGLGRPRVVVFMTDGQSDADKALAAAKTDTGDIRMFTLGLGTEVNRPLLQRLAALKRGHFDYIADASQIERQVGRVAAHIASPLLVDVSIDVEGANAVRLYPRSIPDLFADDELLVTGRLRGTGTAKFIVKGKLAGKPVRFERVVDLGKAPPRPWVGELWAQSRVEHLLEEISLGSAAPEVKNEVIDLALAYNFVTPYTAFLAIPDSELGDMRGTIEAARARKRQVMAANPDAENLKHKDHVDLADKNADEDDAPRHTRRHVASKEDDDGDEDKSEKKPGRVSEKDSVETTSGEETAPLRPASYEGNKRGCGGCATGTAGGESLLLFGVAVIVLRRRRR